MAVSKADAGVKVRIACEDGSAQTISKCNKRATDEQLYNIGNAVSKLLKGSKKAITAISEAILIEE